MFPEKTKPLKSRPFTGNSSPVVNLTVKPVGFGKTIFLEISKFQSSSLQSFWFGMKNFYSINLEQVTLPTSS